MNRTLDHTGKYRILDTLGSGATSTVYLALDEFHQRQVALKVMSERGFEHPVKGKQNRRMYDVEASLSGKLTHPNIAGILDAGQFEDVSYLVMEYVPGGSLKQYCKPDNLLPINDAVDVTFQCSRALAFAHSIGVIHRDVKPDNILVVDGTKIKVSDFGAALSRLDERTQVGNIGTPQYQSPEQCMGHPLDHRSDIFSLGIVMYELLTGQRPFVAENDYGYLHQICNVIPAPPSTHRHELPREVDAVIARAMAKPLDLRYSTWEEFSLDLAALQRGEAPQGQHREIASSEKLRLIETLGLFKDFSDAELWETLHLAAWESYSDGDVLMADGTAGDFFCVLLEGTLLARKNGRTLNYMNPGECFGEMTYIDQAKSTRTADVIARGPVRVMTIRNTDLLAASDQCRHRFHMAFMKMLAERVDLLSKRLSGNTANPG